MLIIPAIDLYEGKAVRLFKGDYRQMKVYSDTPEQLAEQFKQQGAQAVHVVDLEGARDGNTPNLALITRIKAHTTLTMEVGGGIRDMDTVCRYLDDAGVDRVIIGTAAVTDPAFVESATARFGDRIAVGVDIKEGKVAIRGWTEQSSLSALPFCRRMQELGVSTIISTDISKDGALEGTNRELYSELAEALTAHIIASGGISTLEDVIALKHMGLYGAIIGKAWYEGRIPLHLAIEVAS